MLHHVVAANLENKLDGPAAAVIVKTLLEEAHVRPDHADATDIGSTPLELLEAVDGALESDQQQMVDDLTKEPPLTL
jgi:hypothetical protein